MVTFDLVSDTPSRVSGAKLSLNNLDRTIEINDINEKYQNSITKMSDRTETTATNSYVRSHMTPSPTKMRRDRCNFAMSGLNVLNKNQKFEFNPEDLSSVGTMSPNVRDRNVGTHSPNVNHRRIPELGQSMFDFSNKSLYQTMG